MNEENLNFKSDALKNSIREITESKNSGHDFQREGFDDLKKRAFDYIDDFILDRDENSLKKVLEEIHVYHIELEIQNDELLRTRNQLEAQHLKFYELYDLAPIGYLTVDENNTITEINRCASKYLGVAKSEVIGVDFTKFIHRDYQDIFYFKKNEINDNSDEVSFELVLKTQHDNIHCLLNIVRIKRENGTNFFVTIDDISFEKKIQQELEISKANLTSLLESSEEMMASFGINSELTSFNSSFYENMHFLFGIVPLIGMNIFSEFQKSYYEWFYEKINRAYSGENATEILPIINQNKDLVFYKFTFAPILNSGNINGIILNGKNITKEKEVEIKLNISNRKLDNLLSNIPDCVWSITINNHSELVNFYISTNIEFLTGMNSTYFLDSYENYFKYIHQDDQNRYKANINNIINNHKYEKFLDFRLVKYDGTIYWVRDSINLELLDNGSKIIYGVISDITKIKNINFQLKQSESKLKAIFDNSIIAISIQNRLTNFELFNTALCDITGYSKEELHKLTEISITHTEDVELNTKYLTDIFDGKIKNASYEIRYFRKDGTSVWILKSISIMSQANNKIETVLSMIIDINSKKLAEQTLNDKELLLHNITEYANDGIVMIDNFGKVSYWNKAATEIFGYNYDEIVGKDLHQILASKEDYNSFVKVFPKFKISGEGKLVNKTYEMITIKKDGTHFPVELSLSPVKIGNYWQAIAIIRDITERKEIEYDTLKLLEEIHISRDLIEEEKVKMNELNNKLYESEQQLIEIISMRDKFFKIIAHDLRNPIGSFGQLTSLMQENWSELDDNDKIEIIASLDKAATSAYNLLENLLEWARLQTQNTGLNQQNIDLMPLVAKIIGTLELSAENKNIKIQNQLSMNTFAFIDREMIQTVFRNIISNAIKFTKANGLIIISCKEIGNFWEICIEDNGVGMTQEKLSNLFRIDQQVSTRGTNNEKGTGLGLILCKEFIEKNGGKIFVNSEIGKGTKFFFTLAKS